MKLLLISNSTNYGEPYLQWPLHHMQDFLTDSIRRIVFIPYAGVTISYDEYTERVATACKAIDIEVIGIHQALNPVDAIENADAIAVGGGNTFHLLRELYRQNLIEPVRRKVKAGMPYIGWSAGSNVACPTIMTTNDMPIVFPPSFHAFNLVPFQLNPHFTDRSLSNYGGETRSQRLAEYLVANPKSKVVGLEEGCLLHIDGKNVKMVGNSTLKYFEAGKETLEFTPADDLNFLINN